MTGHFKDHAGITHSLKKIAEGTGSPANILQHAMMAAMSKNAGLMATETYEALRGRFRSKPVRGPDGALHDLVALQRHYVRYVLVERYRSAGQKVLDAFHLASEYLADDNHADWSTIRASYYKIKKLLTQPGMQQFCLGLDYVFQIALYGDEPPPLSSYVDPDFMREPVAGLSQN